ncbi:MAG: class I SAM-dependent DNA methyltransferase [Coprococcus sp.]
MEAYTGFAQVYDIFMDNIPYDEWGDYLTSLLRRYGVEDGLVLDMGCGTGAMTRYLNGRNYDMIGIDISEEMLAIAREKSSPEILYLLQDMRSFELYGTVGAVVSICDSINYILNEDELYQVFSLVNNYLDPEGIFIFDLNTVYKYQEVLGEQTIAEDREECSFIWDNYYDEEEMINEYDLSIFVREKDDLFRRYQETHYQRAYPLEMVKKLLEKSGMEVLAIYDAFTYNNPEPDSERVYFIAREHGKRERIENKEL